MQDLLMSDFDFKPTTLRLYCDKHSVEKRNADRHTIRMGRHDEHSIVVRLPDEDVPEKSQPCPAEDCKGRIHSHPKPKPAPKKKRVRKKKAVKKT